MPVRSNRRAPGMLSPADVHRALDIHIRALNAAAAEHPADRVDRHHGRRTQVLRSAFGSVRLTVRLANHPKLSVSAAWSPKGLPLSPR